MKHPESSLFVWPHWLVALGLVGSRTVVAAAVVAVKVGVCPSCWGTVSWRMGGMNLRVNVVWNRPEWT